MLRPYLVLVCSFSVAMGLGASRALCQSPLPEQVRNAQPLSVQDQATITVYAHGALADLGSPDAAKAQAARDRLSTPTLGSTSVSFRLFYSQQIMPMIESMLGPNTDPHRAQLILTVAGSIATDASLRLLLEALKDDRPAVRFGAAREIGVLLAQVDHGRATAQRDRIPRLISTLRQTLATEPDLFVASEIAKALTTPANTQALLDQGLEAMCLGMSDRLDTQIGDAPAAEKIAATLRAIKDARDRLIGGKISGTTPASLNEAAARFALAAKTFSIAIASDASLDDDSATLNDRLQIVADNVHRLATE